MRWLAGRGEKHIRPETLSEYLDGRLPPRSAARVEAHLAVCARCGEELDSLRQTVALLRRVPERKPARSFVMVEAPVPARPAFHVPAWAYGAVASACALAFAVILSVDMVGVLAPAVPPAEPTFKVEAVATPSPVVEEKAVPIPGPVPAPSDIAAPRGLTVEGVAAPEVTPTPAPKGVEPALPMPSPSPAVLAPKETEPPQPTPSPRLPTDGRGATPWVWHLAEGLLGILALAVAGALLLRLRTRSVPR